METTIQRLIDQLKQEIENQPQYRGEFEDGVIQGLQAALELAENLNR